MPFRLSGRRVHRQRLRRAGLRGAHREARRGLPCRRLPRAERLPGRAGMALRARRRRASIWRPSRAPSHSNRQPRSRRSLGIMSLQVPASFAVPGGEAMPDNEKDVAGRHRLSAAHSARVLVVGGLLDWLFPLTIISRRAALARGPSSGRALRARDRERDHGRARLQARLAPTSIRSGRRSHSPAGIFAPSAQPDVCRHGSGLLGIVIGFGARMDVPAAHRRRARHALRRRPARGALSRTKVRRGLPRYKRSVPRYGFKF